MNTTSPLRQTRTRQLLREALMELAAERTFATLTIQEVTRQAGVNRTTFYLHYTGLPELMEDCARILFSQLRADIYANQPVSDPQDLSLLEPYVESVFHHLEEHKRFYRSMLGRQGDPLFLVLFQNSLSELIFEPVENLNSHEGRNQELAMTRRFFSAGFTGVAAWWLENEMPISIQQACRQITRNILPGYLRLIENIH